jgi:hypothetical protein
MNKTIFTLLTGLVLSTSTFAVDTDISKIDGPGGRNVTAFDRVGERKLGGYFDTEFISDANGQNFKAHRFILQLTSQVHEKILFNSEIEMEYGAQIEDTADGTGGDGELKIEQAWADFELADNHFLRSGIVIMPVGLLNILHDSDVRDTTNRPIFAKYIVPTTWMDTGIGAHGNFDVANWEVNYEGYVVNGLEEITSGSAKSGIRSARPGFKSDNNVGSALVARLGLSPFNGLEFGTSIYKGAHSDNGSDSVTLVGLDTMWKHGAYEVMAEYAQVNIDGDSTIPDTMNGYYVEARYHFFPSFLQNSVFDTWYDRPTFTAFARYGEVDLDTSVTDNYDRSQTTIGLNYRPIETAVFKFEAEINEAEAGDSLVNQFNASIALGF